MLATRLAAKREAAEGSKLVDRLFRRLAHQDSDSDDDDDDDEPAISSYDRTQQARRNFQRRRDGAAVAYEVVLFVRNPSPDDAMTVTIRPRPLPGRGGESGRCKRLVSKGRKEHTYYA